MSSQLNLSINFMSLSKTPAISVKNNTRSARSSPAILPAATSALMLYTTVSSLIPLHPMPIGAITGVIPSSNSSFIRSVLTVLTCPTFPKSNDSSSPPHSFSHRSKPSSRPDSPSARPPAKTIPPDIFLFTLPHKTMAATSTTSGVETRIPPSHVLSTPTFSSMALIMGPPPWTTTTRSPSFWRVATSSQKREASSGEVMAFPPYLTTIVLPEREWREEAMVIAFSTNAFCSSVDKSVVVVEILLCS
mmetsp:Transcript_16523/g.39556  ORF Transcript_16523/g.39556 Transcript_16523/m.39556 type:complete len:247 (-) Transcript_16523:120-860(-)